MFKQHSEMLSKDYDLLVGIPSPVFIPMNDCIFRQVEKVGKAISMNERI